MKILYSIIVFMTFFVLNGCASHQELQSYCTYKQRSNCGPAIPLDQRLEKVPSE